MIVFISCGKKKRDCKCNAESMYTGEYFKKCLLYAKHIKPQKIYILSAKYGLLNLDDKISPYEQTLTNKTKKERKKWALMVYKQMINKHIDFNDTAVFLGGGIYREYIIRFFKNAKIPFQGMGIITQMGEINKIIKG